jgi:DNA-binding Lrp family transcriptional regulator
MDDEATKLWNESSRLVINRFQLETVDAPRIVRVIDARNCERFGGFLDPSTGTLVLSSATTAGRIPCRGVVLRETFYHSLPSSLCDEARNDVSSEFAYQSLTRAERSLWEAAWRAMPPRRVRANLTYTSYRTMKWMISLGGERELDSLVHEFLSMSKYGRKLGFIDYLEYMAKRIQRIEVGLNGTELRIVDALLKDQRLSIRNLAQQLELSESWTSALVNRLRNGYILRATTSTPFSRIGIRTFHILLGSRPEDDTFRYLTDCPFLYNIQHILNGPWQVLARLAIPDNDKSVQSLQTVADTLNDNGIAVDVSETHSAALAHSFYHYNVANRRWEIPWVAMQGWGQRIQNESLDEVVERIDTPAHMTDMYLDELNLKILECVSREITSSRALRNELRVGQNRLADRLVELRHNGLIRTNWNAHNIGLVESVAVRTSDRKTAQFLDVWSRELPKAFLRYGQLRDLLMIIELPTGGSSRLMETIRDLGWHASVSLLGGSIWGQWSFPVNLWNVEHQRWDAPIERIDSWLVQLDHELEVEVKEAPESHVSSQYGY